MSRYGAAVFVALVMVALAEGFPQQQPRPAGTAYDEIVVETQLAVRPKAAAAGAGLALRTARAKAVKAVFFRPNVTAEARRVVPTGSTPTTTTASGGISYAARVVGVENPMAAAARARSAAARSRRESTPNNPGGYTSSSSSSHYSSSYSSGSGSGLRPAELRVAGSTRTGPTGPTGLAALAAPAATTLTGTSSGKGSATRTYTRTLGGGRTVSVNEADEYSYSQGPDSKGPMASRLLTVIIGGQ